MENRILLTLLAAAHSLNHSFFLVLPPIIPLIIKDTGASVEMIGLATTAGYVVYGVGSLAGGALSDRIGEDKVLIISLGLSGLSTAIIFFFPTIAGLAVGFFFMAVWASLYHPTANSVISKAYTSNTAVVMGIHGAAASVGQAATPVVAVLVGLALGWHSAFFLFGMIATGVSLFFFRVAVKSDHTKRLHYGRRIMEAFQMRAVWILLIEAMFAGLCLKGLEFILPTFLVEGRSLSIEMAGLASSIVLAFGALGQLLGGRYSDRMGGRTTLILSGLGTMVGLVILLRFSGLAVGVVAFAIIYGVSYFARQPAETSLAATYSKYEVRGAVYGALFFMIYGLGSFSVAIAGYSVDHMGPDFTIMLILIYSLISLVLVFFLPKNREQANVH